MKAIKAIMLFVIFYFIVVVSQTMIDLGNWVSRGNIYFLYAYYGVLVLLAIIYLVVPIIDYFDRPSFVHIENLMNDDLKAAKRVRRYLLKVLDEEEKLGLKEIDPKDLPALKKWVMTYVTQTTATFDKIIKSYAFKLTSTVLLSPNAFIDGLAILYGNSSMIYQLSKKIKFRYTSKELFNMYFAVLSVASVSGLIEEFDDEIEELIRGVVEEFSEAMSQETGKSVGDSIPFLNIAVKASTILFQAAGNYAFIMYNGKRFKYTVNNLVAEERKTEEGIRKLARKEARISKYVYVQDMIKRMGRSGAQSLKDLVSKKSYSKEDMDTVYSELDDEVMSKSFGFGKWFKKK